MKAREAIRKLDEELGSGNDPVVYGGRECDLYELEHLARDLMDGPASKVHFGYWGLAPGGLTFVKRGSLAGMVADRMRKGFRATPRPQRSGRKVRTHTIALTPHYVWCEHHAEIHSRERDFYGEHAQQMENQVAPKPTGKAPCNVDNWTPVYIGWEHERDA